MTCHISVVILTYNEEINLPDALASLVGQCDDVVVFDSFSADSTVEIGRTSGARIFQRAFDNYAAQRSAALETVSFKYPWVLMLDADERVPSELWRELQSTLATASDGVTLFRLRRKDFFMNRWLRRSSGYPTWFGRIMRPGRVTIVREINEEYHTDGEIRHLKEHLLHFPFNRGIAYWIARHNQYSSAEAKVANSGKGEAVRLSDFLTIDPTKRRRALKRIAMRLPARPLVIFGYLYFVRLGFLDGLAGLRFCLLRTIYEYMIDIKLAELQILDGPMVKP